MVFLTASQGERRMVDETGNLDAFNLLIDFWKEWLILAIYSIHISITIALGEYEAIFHDHHSQPMCSGLPQDSLCLFIWPICTLHAGILQLIQWCSRMCSHVIVSWEMRRYPKLPLDDVYPITPDQPAARAQYFILFYYLFGKMLC